MQHNEPLKELEATSNWKSQLGDLANPSHYVGAINIHGCAPSLLINSLHEMVKIRIAEETIADMVTVDEVKCPVHLAIGQEAVCVGIAKNLRASDRAFGNHRSHGHYLAMGGGVRELFAEVMGKSTGCSRGFGGSMHLFAREIGFFGSVPIVAGTIPLAVGAGIAAKFDGEGNVAVAFFGDGACEEGVFHECLNMAAIMQLPVIFVVENNLFSSHLDINLRQPSDKISRFAQAACISHKTIDGNDVANVMKEAGELIAQARAQNAPALIEAVTYRWRGHVGPREDIDVGLRRSQEDIAAWKMRDPVERLLKSLIAGNYYSRGEFAEFAGKTRDDFAKIRADIYNDPWPAHGTLMDYVYASK